MAVTNINNAWKNDLYPLIDKVFDFEYRNRLGALRKIVSEVDSHSAEYRVEGMGGYGELPEYTGELHNMDQRRGFVTVIRPVQKAGAIDIDYKYAKIDKSGEARSAGRRAAYSAAMSVYMGVLRMFGSAFDKSVLGGDGKPWAAADHPIASDHDEDGVAIADAEAGTYSNLITDELSVAAITKANIMANRFVTPDGLPFLTDYFSNGILLVSPELEGKAREICGPQAKMSPQLNPDSANNAANPVCGMQYMVIGGGDVGFTAKQWAVADASLLRECAKVIYISRPTVIRAALDNPLIARVVPYVDFGVGWTDARPIIFSNPA
ncbi:MAG: hypothetical protein KIG74_00660 [Clostridiaceae bacterium]|nr:hypothetical protein [Clostridiaceae bacterium]